ncbi:MAG: hypothetical protein M3O50_01180 [Myxococcota bacterium]|nr:hypothetical protein [Myxococcota bacterium]
MTNGVNLSYVTTAFRRAVVASLFVSSAVCVNACSATPDGAAAEQEDLAHTAQALATGFAVTTNRYDNGRSGTNLAETTLTTSNVNKNLFGLLFSRVVDGGIYAQPLYVGNLAIGGVAHNVVYVATQRDKVYAFDADAPTATSALWSRDLGPAGPASDFSCTDMVDKVGITSTPVIDTSSGTMYLLAKVKQGSTWSQHLHALDISTGADRPGSPVTITASVPGTGAGSSHGMVSFDPKFNLNRAGLLLWGGNIYIGFASHCDEGAYHGWVLAYDARTLRQSLAFTPSPNGSKGGIWQGGVGLSADSSGIYVAAGNGSTNPNASPRDLSEGVMRLGASDFSIKDFWVPSAFSSLNHSDADLSTGAILVPQHNLVVTGSKDGRLYVLNRSSLGGFNSQRDNIIQTVITEGKSAGQRGHLHGGPIFYSVPSVGDVLYLWPEESRPAGYKMASSGTLGTPFHANVATPGHPGGILTLSANGSQAGSAILWASAPVGDAWHQTQPGILYALNPVDLSVLWDTTQNASRDGVGNFAKFTPPVVANGRVYMATFSGELRVYGLLH